MYNFVDIENNVIFKIKEYGFVGIDDFHLICDNYDFERYIFEWANFGKNSPALSYKRKIFICGEQDMTIRLNHCFPYEKENNGIYKFKFSTNDRLPELPTELKKFIRNKKIDEILG